MPLELWSAGSKRSSSCQPCPAGTYNPNMGGSTGRTIRLRWWNAGGGSAALLVHLPSASPGRCALLVWPAGSTTDSSCIKCPAGTFNINSGCPMCPSPNTRCCHADITMAHAAGSASSTACEKCGAGTRNPIQGERSSQHILQVSILTSYFVWLSRCFKLPAVHSRGIHLPNRYL